MWVWLLQCNVCLWAPLPMFCYHQLVLKLHHVLKWHGLKPTCGTLTLKALLGQMRGHSSTLWFEEEARLHTEEANSG